MKVLVVEDSNTRRGKLVEYFRSRGHQVLETDTCATALAMLSANPDVQLITWDGALADGRSDQAIMNLSDGGFRGSMVAASGGRSDRRSQMAEGCIAEIDPEDPATWPSALDTLLSER